MKCLLIVVAVFAACEAGAVYSPYTYGLGAYPYNYGAHPYAYAGQHAALPYAGHHAALPYAAHAIAAPALKSQYHAQDELGQASYGYAHPGQAHSAVRDAAGHVRGSYAYINPEGREIRVDYVADEGGFRVASNALPEGPVAQAAPLLVGPAPVQDTPEVVEARARHFAAVEEAKSRSKRGVAAVLSTPAATAPLALGHSSLLYSSLAHPYATVGHAAVSPLAYSYGHHAAPLAYAGYGYAAAPYSYGHHAGIAAPIALTREAVQTTVVNNPGHAVSYRID